MRRASFPIYFTLELLTGSLLPLAAIIFVAVQTGVSPLAASLALSVIWYGSEILFAVKAGWHVSRYSPLCTVLRDLMLPLLWLDAWSGSGFEWRGTPMRAFENARAS